MKDQKEKFGNISFSEEMQPVTLVKERTILDDDDIGRKGQRVNTKSEVEDEIVDIRNFQTYREF